ncbi:LysR family transcriptional regulator [Clostridium sp. chh4-2]|uniref:LysR family transcriptional regulator n=1 Tax=Clostridium sp. chh4-2 TaxID=2067550 RepID=UPI000CCDC24F|nr:LysR family transcriptional regulator [Clostridium sp. chh4-2]PNV59907.1 LysR family transcriptional regulator [Clostridium sp. chh4-2]
MDTKYLEYIITIAKEQNMRKAADKLFVSQSSLSQYLNKLETEVGTPLFYRTAKGLTLTPAGELYVETAQTMMSLKKRLYQNIANLSYQEHLVIGTTSQWAIRLLTKVIPIFKERYPGIMLEITESFSLPMRQRMADKEVDFCLATTLRTDDFFKESKLLGTEELYLAVPKSHHFSLIHPSFSYSVTAEDLKDYFANDNFLLTQKGSSMQMLVDTLIRPLGFRPKVFGYMDNIQSICGLVSTGVGVSFIPGSCIGELRNVNLYSMSPQMKRYNIIGYQPQLMDNPAVAYLTELLEAHYIKTS